MEIAMTVARIGLAGTALLTVLASAAFAEQGVVTKIDRLNRRFRYSRPSPRTPISRISPNDQGRGEAATARLYLVGHTKLIPRWLPLRKWLDQKLGIYSNINNM